MLRQGNRGIPKTTWSLALPVIDFSNPLALAILSSAAAALVTAVLVGLLQRVRYRKLMARENASALKAREQLEAQYQGTLAELQQEHRVLQTAERNLSAANAALSTDNHRDRTTIIELQHELSSLRADNQKLNRLEAELRTQLQEVRKSFAEKEALFKESSEALKSEFQLLANKIFEKQGLAFRDQNKNQLNDVLKPFKEQIHDFKRRVDEVHLTDSKDRASLLTQVLNLQKASERINQEAGNLTRALKGDKKLQGNWGEMVLETVLQGSGLRNGYEYTTQTSLRNEEGDLKRPDVVIHLPDDKDIVVDAKVSLIAYEQALASEDEKQRQKYIRQHIGHLRDQIKRLSDQNYESLKGVRSLDFVLLFLPIEPAFTLAMEEDPGIFSEAFKKRIMIVSPTTLMMTLRIIHNIWRYEKQNKNAQKIAQRAGAIYDKLRVTLNDMESLGNALKTADRNFESAMRKLANGRGNLVAQVEQFRELGAGVRKPFTKAVLEDANAELSTLDRPQDMAQDAECSDSIEHEQDHASILKDRAP